MTLMNFRFYYWAAYTRSIMLKSPFRSLCVTMKLNHTINFSILAFQHSNNQWLWDIVLSLSKVISDLYKIM